MKLSEILVIEESPLARQFRHVVDIVDHLHRWPALPPIPLVLTKNRRENGAYNYRDRPLRPLNIAVSVHGDFPPLTLLHEIGHLLDHVALNPIQRRFGSEHDPLFEPLREFWSQSKSIRKLISILARSSHLASERRRLIRHQLETREIWARTYMQWVVVASNDLLLQTFLNAVIQKPLAFGRISTHFCWEDREMNDIIPLVNTLFSAAGLA